MILKTIHRSLRSEKNRFTNGNVVVLALMMLISSIAQAQWEELGEVEFPYPSCDFKTVANDGKIFYSSRDNWDSKSLRLGVFSPTNSDNPLGIWRRVELAPIEVEGYLKYYDIQKVAGNAVSLLIVHHIGQKAVLSQYIITTNRFDIYPLEPVQIEKKGGMNYSICLMQNGLNKFPVVVYSGPFATLKAKTVEGKGTRPLPKLPKDHVVVGPKVLIVNDRSGLEYVLIHAGEILYLCYLDQRRPFVNIQPIPSQLYHAKLASAGHFPILITYENKLQIYGMQDSDWSPLLGFDDQITINKNRAISPDVLFQADGTHAHFFQQMEGSRKVEVVTFQSNIEEEPRKKLSWKRTNQEYVFEKEVSRISTTQDYELGSIAIVSTLENPTSIQLFRFVADSN